MRIETQLRPEIVLEDFECLVTGFHNERGEVALCVPDRDVPLGSKLL